MPLPQGYKQISSPYAGRIRELKEERQVTIEGFRAQMLEKISSLRAELPVTEQVTLSNQPTASFVLGKLYEEIKNL